MVSSLALWFGLFFVQVFLDEPPELTPALTFARSKVQRIPSNPAPGKNKKHQKIISYYISAEVFGPKPPRASPSPAAQKPSNKPQHLNSFNSP